MFAEYNEFAQDREPRAIVAEGADSSPSSKYGIVKMTRNTNRALLLTPQTFRDLGLLALLRHVNMHRVMNVICSSLNHGV